MKKKNEKKSKIIIASLSIIFVILIFLYGNILLNYINKRKFAQKNIEIYINNKEQVFKVEKIILCSSANAIDKSNQKNLKNLNIYQYTDIAIYIDNGEELSNKNTVSKLYIDNISLEGIENKGSKSLNYKNISNFGLKEDIEEEKSMNNTIDFNIIYTNDEDEEADYNQPTFYTDCSNPITLEYLNYNLIEDYKIEENNSLLFDGSILEKAGIQIQDINCKVKFKINLVNNQNNKYSTWININIPLNDIYKGTTMKSKATNDDKYIFFREV